MSGFDGVAACLQVLQDCLGCGRGAIVGLRPKQSRPLSIKSAVDVVVFV